MNLSILHPYWVVRSPIKVNEEAIRQNKTEKERTASVAVLGSFQRYCECEKISISIVVGIAGNNNIKRSRVYTHVILYLKSTRER